MTYKSLKGCGKSNFYISISILIFFWVKVDSRFLLIIWVVFSLIKSTWSHEQTPMQLIRSSSYASNQVGMFQGWPLGRT